MTISPKLLQELSGLSRDDSPELKKAESIKETARDARIRPNRATFEWQLSENAMATEKLAEGIQRFAADQRALEKHLG